MRIADDHRAQQAPATCVEIDPDMIRAGNAAPITDRAMVERVPAPTILLAALEIAKRAGK